MLTHQYSGVPTTGVCQEAVEQGFLVVAGDDDSGSCFQSVLKMNLRHNITMRLMAASGGGFSPRPTACWDTAQPTKDQQRNETAFLGKKKKDCRPTPEDAVLVLLCEQ